MKPKFKVGQKVRLKLEKQIRKEQKIKNYLDSTGLMHDMQYGNIVEITDVDKNKNHAYFEYKIKEDYGRYFYHEEWLESFLDKKINKILKL